MSNLTPFKDIMGKPLEIGDTVAVAFPNGSGALQRVGTIKSLGDIKSSRWDRNVQHYVTTPTPCLIIEWDQSISYGAPSKPTKIKDTTGRFIKL